MAHRKQIVTDAVNRVAPGHRCEVDYTMHGRGEIYAIETKPLKYNAFGYLLSIEVVQHHAVDFMYRRTVLPVKWVVRTRKLEEKWYRWGNHKEFDTLEEAAEELAKRITV